MLNSQNSASVHSMIWGQKSVLPLLKGFLWEKLENNINLFMASMVFLSQWKQNEAWIFCYLW